MCPRPFVPGGSADSDRDDALHLVASARSRQAGQSGGVLIRLVHASQQRERMNGRHALIVGFAVGRIHANPRMKGLHSRIDHGRNRQPRRQDDRELLLQG